MARITLDCPHCEDRNVPFEIVGHPYRFATGTRLDVAMAAQCTNPACSRFIAIEGRVISDDFHRLINVGLTPETRLDGHLAITHVWPKPPRPEVPDYLPEHVADLFLEAEQVRLNKTFRAAINCYRSVIDVATSDLIALPDADRNATKMNLFQRIKTLADAHRITPALADWANTVRLFGNETVHEGSRVTAAEAEETANFTRMFLIHAYEMPGRVAAMRSIAEERKNAATA